MRRFRAKSSDFGHIIARPNFFQKGTEGKYFKPWGIFDLHSGSGKAALGNAQTSRRNCSRIKLEFENRWQVRFCPEAVVCWPLIKCNAETGEVNLLRGEYFLLVFQVKLHRSALQLWLYVYKAVIEGICENFPKAWQILRPLMTDENQFISPVTG